MYGFEEFLERFGIFYRLIEFLRVFRKQIQGELCVRPIVFLKFHKIYI